MRSPLAENLLTWYQENKRILPWRDQPDPYAVWVSEIMLQQTRVETVVPYFTQWLERFPTIASLAAAPLQTVLAAWEGLGYYRRAHNLHKAAQIVMRDIDGRLPEDAKQLRKLPGIGKYTAGAIASIAFNRDEPTLDGNIRRVTARLFDLQEPAQSTSGQRRLWELATAHLPPGEAGNYNQALMDLGASICTPRQPGCTRCPVSEFCQARLLGVQEQRPILRAKAAIPHYEAAAAVISQEDHVLIARRPLNGLLSGLWEFPGGRLEPGETLAGCLKREICEELGVDIQIGAPLGIYRHAYTHFRVTLHAFCCQLRGSAEPLPLAADEVRWAAPAELASFPMGKLDRQIARKIYAEEPCSS